MTTIRQREDELFSRWEKELSSSSKFIRDGVIEEPAYIASRPRLLFILKEPNEGECLDLRKGLSDAAHSNTNDGYSPTYGRIAGWAMGIRSPNRSWEEVGPWRTQKRELLSIAVMNLNKVPSGSKTRFSRLLAAATSNQAWLQEQFKLYDADIVICCGAGVGLLVNKLLLPDSKWSPTLGVPYESTAKKFMVSWYHPAVRRKGCVLFSGLIDAIRRLPGIEANKEQESR